MQAIANREEVRLLRKVAEASSDLQKGFNDPEFCRVVGGTEVLKEEHAKAVKNYERWVDEEADV